MEMGEYQGSAMKEESSGIEDEVLYTYYQNHPCECDQEMMDLVELSFCVCITRTIFNACPGDA